MLHSLLSPDNIYRSTDTIINWYYNVKIVHMKNIFL